MTGGDPLGVDPLEATVLIRRAAEADAVAAERLLPLVYARLRSLAGSSMRECAEETLQPTPLVHEVSLRRFAMPEAAHARRRTRRPDRSA